MIQVNCSVQDCSYQINGVCSKPMIEVNRVGICQSFTHLAGSQSRDLSKIYPSLKEDSS